jgi:hypothetical protein
LSDKNCWGEGERERERIGPVLFPPWSHDLTAINLIFRTASDMWSVESNLVIYGIEEGITAIIAAAARRGEESTDRNWAVPRRLLWLFFPH